MSWVKKGHIFRNDPSLWWSQNYAGIPTAELINEDTIRIYYYSMDENMDGRISYINVSAINPSNVLYVHAEPILDIGMPGTFDDCGVCPSTIINIADKKYLYYLGVQRAEKVPYLYFAGLAEIQSDTHAERTQITPILDRVPSEAFTRSATTILKNEESYIMIYVSAYEWIEWNGRQYPKYTLRQTVSDDGLHWNNPSTEIFTFKDSSEFGFGRPWLTKQEDVFKLYYSIRSTNEPYKMGYAESVDGQNWLRNDEEINIPRSENGWDSEMICYPCVIETKYGQYMFYNGNKHGESGFGYAKWEV